MQNKPILYGRSECPLCDEAEDLLRASGFSYTYQSIEGDVNLLSAYRTRIPVLRNPDSGVELDWPFDEKSLATLMESR